MSLMLIFFIASCTEDTRLLPSEYIKWIDNESNDLTRSKGFSGITFQLKYRPIDYIISQEFKTNNIDPREYEERKKVLEGMIYFSLRIQNEDKSAQDVLFHNIMSDEEYFDRVNYYSFEFQNDIFLIQKQDTVMPGLFNFVRTHGVAPYVDFVFAFPDKTIDKKKGYDLVIEDRIFNTGALKFKYTQEQLNNLPELILN